MWKYDPDRKEFTTRDIGARGNYTEIKEGRGTPNHTIIVDNRDFDPEILKRWQTTSPFRYHQCCQAFGMEARKLLNLSISRLIILELSAVLQAFNLVKIRKVKSGY